MGTHLWRPGPPWAPEVQLSVPARNPRVRSGYLLSFLPVSKFSLRAVSLVKTGHPFRPPPTNSLHKWGRNRAGWGSRLRGGRRKGEEPKVPAAERWGRQKKRESARAGRPSAGPRSLVPSLRQLLPGAVRVEVVRASREPPKRAPRRGPPLSCARSWSLEAGARRHRRLLGRVAAGGLAAGSRKGRGPWRAQKPFLFIRSRRSACCHRFFCGLAWGPRRLPGLARLWWRRGNLCALCAAPPRPHPAWRRPLRPQG